MIKVTRVHDLDPSPCADNVHESVEHEMEAIEPSEIPSRTLNLETFGFPKPPQSSFER